MSITGVIIMNKLTKNQISDIHSVARSISVLLMKMYEHITLYLYEQKIYNLSYHKYFLNLSDSGLNVPELLYLVNILLQLF